MKFECQDSTSSVVIIDYGTGNINSVGRTLDQIGCRWKLSSAPYQILSASHIILPGVGHAGQAMTNLKSSNILEALNEAVLVRKIPTLGICLGMQLMTRHTEEGSCDCLGWFTETTVELTPSISYLKVPNIGWHTITPRKRDPILSGIDIDRSPFYFCHRYGVHFHEEQYIVAELKYEDPYAAILRKENIIGVQFHPEKSQDSGVKLFQNFLSISRKNV